jgi:hypothetical protein
MKDKLIRYWYLPVILILLLLLWISQNRGSKFQEQTETLVEKNNQLSSQLITFQGKNKELHTKTQAVETDIRGLKALADSKDVLIQRIKNDYEIKLKNVRAAAEMESEIGGEFQDVFVDIDTIRVLDTLRDTVTTKIVRGFVREEEWFRMRAVLNGDTLVYFPVFVNKQDVIFHDDRIPKRFALDFFPPKRLYVEVTHLNPYVDVKKLRAFSSKKRGLLARLFNYND